MAAATTGERDQPCYEHVVLHGQLELLTPWMGSQENGASDSRRELFTTNWDELLEAATATETRALRRLELPLIRLDKNLLTRAIEIYPRVLEGATDWRMRKHPLLQLFERTAQKAPCKRYLAMLLLAKIVRRLNADRRGRVRTSLFGGLAQTSAETGSAAAIAKRVNPLGAPPQIA